ncbi:transcription termination factor NusA [Desulforegula conservatrix]|uniref:transcription termination factor NusA n=1 Tax=Desulforegula conservatrix TaxID=153026 RepID=UPI00048A103F|nr:transcription termination factor NusA [Desulforegula conservatrix]
MMFNEIKRVIDQVSRDKGIDSSVLIKTIEEAIASAARKKLGPHAEIEVQYKPVTGEIEVFQFKEVVTKVTDPATQINLAEGRELDPECEPGDSLGIKMDTALFGRIAAQSAKQVIIQKMKDAEKDAVYEGFINRKGEIINGIVQRIDRGDIIVNLGQTDALLPAREQIPREIYRRGDRIRANIMKVLHDARGPQIVLTRTHPSFLINLFKAEVPEINEGIVLIQAAAREPGSRGKIAVSSIEMGIDPVGACVGVKGNRVQNVVQELRGEKIDIIAWDMDQAKFVCNALAPAEIARVIIDEDNKSMEVIVPTESLSIAIGKKGQNVRLASKLTGWRLDVISEEKYSKALKEGYDALMILPSIGMVLAEKLYEHGFVSPEIIRDASTDDLMAVEGMTLEDAEKIIQESAALLDQEIDDTDQEPEENIIQESASLPDQETKE